jgi:hypothetical protein
VLSFDDEARREGAPSWIETPLLQALDGKLWHAANEDAWHGIVADGAIRIDAQANFWNAFCRSIGAVSLVDLSQPDTATSPAAAHWSQWLGALDDKPRYWIEINREAVGANLLTPAVTLDRWRAALADGAQSLRIIAGIEAAHLGHIALHRTVRVLRVQSGRWLAD